MSTTGEMLPENCLDDYGRALETYRGRGELFLGGERRVGCEFVAGQLENGKTLALCATADFLPDVMFGLTSPSSLKGITAEGYEFQVHQIVSETNYLPDSVAEGTYLALRVGHATVSRPRACSRRQVTFLLVNLKGILAKVDFMCDGLKFILEPVKGSRANLQRLEVLRGVLPTAQLRVTTRASLERVINAADEVCYLLSIALGTKVQWIALTEATGAGSWLTRHHYSRVTKQYGSLHPLNTQGRGVGKFLQISSDGRFSRAKERVGLSTATIDTYLDAKAEGDFLQVRALKLVAAVEMFKAEFVEKLAGPSWALPREEFAQMMPKFKEAIRGLLPGSTAEQRRSINANLLGLNRIPFSTQLRELCEAVGMSLENEGLSRFVASRNKLVHEGRFYCERATEEEKRRLTPLPRPVDEWFWLVHFVDRLFLRAIGYEGEYIDWSVPSSPEVRQLMLST